MREYTDKWDEGLPSPDSDAGSISVRYWLRRWFDEDVSGVVTPSVAAGHHRAVERIIPLLGAWPLSALQPRHVNNVERRLAEKYSPSAGRQSRTALSLAFRYAIRKGILRRNPARRQVDRSRPLVSAADVTSRPNSLLDGEDVWEIIDRETRETLTVGEWLGHWLGYVKHSRKQSTYDRYVKIMERQLIPLLGDVLLQELTLRHVYALQRHLLDAGLSVRTVDLVLSVLSGACAHAYRLEIIAGNPVTRLPRPRRHNVTVSPPSMGTVRELLALAETETPDFYPFLRLLVYTGMRKGEAIALRWDNVDLDRGTLRVTEAASKTSQGLLLDTPKSRQSVRMIDLDETTVAVLRRHRERQKEEHRGRGDRANPSLVFTNARGEYLKLTTIDRTLKSLGKSVGAPNITFHGFRHFHASVALQSHQNVLLISRRLGHSSAMMTLDMYGHEMAGWQRGLANSISDTIANEVNNGGHD